MSDRIRMSLVSKSWSRTFMRADIPVPPEIPWLILSAGESECSSNEICFENLSEEKFYRIELPVEELEGTVGRRRRREWRCCGSSNGWLLITGGVDVFLWNPISRITRKLPSISTIPSLNQLAGEGIELGLTNMACFVSRLHVFSVGSVECVVAALFTIIPKGQNRRHELALCTPHDPSWSICGEGKQHMFREIIFHNGKLCASCTDDPVMKPTPVADGGTAITTANYTLHLSCCDVEVDVLRLMYEDFPTEHQQRVDSSGVTIIENVLKAEHLVESVTGELLAVNAVQDLCSYYSWGAEDPIESFTRTLTREFEVWRRVGDRLEKMNSIGEQCLFVGATGSLSLVSYGDDAERIYFTIDDAGGIEDDTDDDDEDNEAEEVMHREEEKDEYEDLDSQYVVREQGVYFVQQEEIFTTSSTKLGVLAPYVTGWFTPKLFQKASLLSNQSF